MVLSMMEYASFYLEIHEETGGRKLLTKTWNSLWLFHLLAIACRSQCNSLYSWSDAPKMRFAVATAHTAFKQPVNPIQASTDQLVWAQGNLASFESLQEDRAFTHALLSYTNSHHLFGYNSRVMQLWSGIECLFKVSSEITRTIAMYSALLIEESSAEERYRRYKEIKKAYGARSKVVHGDTMDDDSLMEAYASASELLVKLLSRCVELSRVPSIDELDRAALVGCITAKVSRSE